MDKAKGGKQAAFCIARIQPFNQKARLFYQPLNSLDLRNSEEVLQDYRKRPARQPDEN